MTDSPDDAKTGPVFRLQKMYVKDLSFENPNAPGIFLDNPNPKAEVNLTFKNQKVDDDHWEVNLRVTTTVKSGEKTAFLVEIEHAGVFLLRNIPDEQLPTEPPQPHHHHKGEEGNDDRLHVGRARLVALAPALLSRRFPTPAPRSRRQSAAQYARHGMRGTTCLV